jgi:hypothetical protein
MGRRRAEQRERDRLPGGVLVVQRHLELRALQPVVAVAPGELLLVVAVEGGVVAG